MYSLIAQMSDKMRFEDCVAIAHNGMRQSTERLTRSILKDAKARRVWNRMNSWAFRYKKKGLIEWRHYRRENEIMRATDYADLMDQLEKYNRKWYGKYPYQAHYEI